VAIAPERGQRPGAAPAVREPPTAEELEACPFCEGRESQTPPEAWALGPPGRVPGTPGWRVRVVPNRYPAFARHEVVVHVPHHARSLADLGPGELHRVAEAWQARAPTDGGGYLHAFVNDGHEAGASLSHSHSQLVWLEETPPVVQAEVEYWREHGCGICALVAAELEREERLLWQEDGLVALCPSAGRAPYELLVAPVEHEPDGLRSTLLGAALALAGRGARALYAVEGPRPFNAWLHAGEHWHLELVPRFAGLGGMELGAGIAINPLPPEQAAAALRGAAGP
jgi:UDPglucose--hexose-1-phosphate uridylyltransferase